MNKRKAKIGTFSTVDWPFKKECVFDLCSVQNSHISSVWEDQENLFLLTVFGLWLQPAVPVIVSQSVHHCHIAVTKRVHKMNSKEKTFGLQPQTMAAEVCGRQGPWQGKSICILV